MLHHYTPVTVQQIPKTETYYEDVTAEVINVPKQEDILRESLNMNIPC